MIRLVIHGGAGALPRHEMTPARAAEFHAALRTALLTGHRILAGGGSALDAVEATVVALEDCPLFNAGRGSAFTREGTVEMEASIMDGATLRAGASLLLRQVRNPVRLARLIMERTGHVTLAADAAERFAAEHGLALEPPAYFFTQFRYDAMLRLRGTDRTTLSEDEVVPAVQPTDQDASGTVGAVALDQHGHLAAATSSGGTTNKRAGRVGQACAIGGGCFADDATCAVSCTGHGEAFVRTAAAHDLAARLRYQGTPLADAAAAVLRDRIKAVGGRGGLIALDAGGRFTLPFNTQGMYRGWIGDDARGATGIYDASTEQPLG
ncbi:MAG TPA: isoaspartyl peptidase/L-asparaginase [Opitutaceae bacterium]|nr:isoaspartyl peptidase/L-asparaginase [Opitutaceae bacterium]